MFKLTYLGFFLICTVIFTITAAYSQSISTEQKNNINEYLRSLSSEDHPGFAVGVVRQGEVVFTSYRGLASMQHQVPIDSSSRFNVASVAKQFTALGVLDLILKDSLRLDDDLRKFLPEFYPEIEDSIQIKHLLNHSSGIRDFYDLLSLKRDPWWRKEGFDNQDAILLLSHQSDLNFRPGQDYMYSNSNYTLLTKVIEKVTNLDFHTYSSELFKRLGMPHTQFLKNYMYLIPNQALPYADWGDGRWQQYPMMTNLYGDGFLFTTLPDQLRYEALIQKNDVLKNPLLTISQQHIAGAEISTYGYGLELSDRLNRKAVHHSGGTGAYHAQTVRYPEEKLTVVVMSNNSKLWSGFIADRIASILLPEKEKSEILFGLDPLNYSRTMDHKDLVANYQSPEGEIIRIREEEGNLIWQQDNNRPITLEKDTGSLYYFKGNSKTKVGFGTDAFTVYYPGSEPRSHLRMDPFEPDDLYFKNVEGDYYNAELDLAFSIIRREDNTMEVQYPGIKRVMNLQIVDRDRFLMNDYKLKIVKKDTGVVSSILLTFNRLKDIEFIKMEKHSKIP